MRCSVVSGAAKEAVEGPHTQPPTGLTTCLGPGGYWRPARHDLRGHYPEQKIISPEVLLTLRGNVHPGSHPLL